jgi:hypothetical protein
MENLPVLLEKWKALQISFLIFFLRHVKRDLLVPSLLTGHMFERPPPPAEYICSPTSKKQKTR